MGFDPVQKMCKDEAKVESTKGGAVGGLQLAAFCQAGKPRCEKWILRKAALSHLIFW